MGQAEPTRQADNIIPPIKGSIPKFAVTTSVLVIDLSTWPQTAALPATTVKGSQNKNPIGQYLCLIPDGATVYVAFADTYAALAGLSATATSSVDGTGKITILGTETVPLPGGTLHTMRPPPGNSGYGTAWGSLSPARFMGLITATGSTTCAAWISSL